MRRHGRADEHRRAANGSSGASQPAALPHALAAVRQRRDEAAGAAAGCGAAVGRRITAREVRDAIRHHDLVQHFGTAAIEGFRKVAFHSGLVGFEIHAQLLAERGVRAL